MYYGRLLTYYLVLLIELPTFWSFQINRKRENQLCHVIFQ